MRERMHVIRPPSAVVGTQLPRNECRHVPEWRTPFMLREQLVPSRALRGATRACETVEASSLLPSAASYFLAFFFLAAAFLLLPVVLLVFFFLAAMVITFVLERRAAAGCGCCTSLRR